MKKKSELLGELALQVNGCNALFPKKAGKKKKKSSVE